MTFEALTLPNFFILGAAKSGTTTLYALLREHPDIFLPEQKEPQFFSNEGRFEGGIESYAKQFAQATQPARGEATPHYLAYEKVAHRIKEFIPEAGHRFIVILRDPVERAESLYWNMVYEGVEDLPFDQALQAEERRAENPEVLRRGSLRHMYFSSGLYGRQLSAYFELFSRDRFLILRLDELRADADGVVRKICAFLNVDPDFQPERSSGAQNRSGTVRSRRIHQFLRKPHWIKEPLKALIPDDLRHALIKRFLDWNKKEQGYEPMSPEVERQLRARFAPDIELLMRCTGEDFSDWLPGRKSGATNP